MAENNVEKNETESVKVTSQKQKIAKPTETKTTSKKSTTTTKKPSTSKTTTSKSTKVESKNEEVKDVKAVEENVMVETQVEETRPTTSNSAPLEISAPKPKFVPTEDAQKNKNIAWLAYILFFIPLCINSQSPFVRHHANEGLEINIFDVLGLTLLLVGALVKSTSAVVQGMMIIFVIIGIGILVLTLITKIYMIVSTLKGKETETPWMWNLKIIK